jgi:Helix-turn-helix.
MVENINRLLYQKNWSIRQLADEAELPYESVKKLVGGKVNNPTIYTISKVCDALNCSIDYILGRSVINTIDKKSLPPRVFNLLVEIAYFESRIADYNKSHKTDCISVLTPTGYVQDGMVFDSISTNIVNISAYKKDFGDIVLCGIKIVGRNLSPTYFDNDILLIGKDRFPESGETGIFLLEIKCIFVNIFRESGWSLLPLMATKTRFSSIISMMFTTLEGCLQWFVTLDVSCYC